VRSVLLSVCLSVPLAMWLLHGMTPAGRIVVIGQCVCIVTALISTVARSDCVRGLLLAVPDDESRCRYVG